MLDAAPSLASRWDQLFPVLTELEMAHVGRFGAVRRYERGAHLFEAGKPIPGMFVVLKGSVTVSQHDAHGLPLQIVRLDVGQFSGEVALLSGVAWDCSKPGPAVPY